ncbi:proteasome subunit beta type-7-like [Cebus imitator]|uniref:proteasome subunit beta type-7-like n=1 Tax=Cebus imitator TaxID=2715852 RepID=UPI001899E49E|nr:proteasome subunit beta type-7-like [Cebus imitator]
MAAVSVYAPPVGGFSFDNCRRNAVLEADFAKKGHKLPKARKTGTTIAGVVYKDGIVLGADTRATEGMVVADKNCSKIHFISPNIYCCGAGTAADTDMTTQLISSNLELHSLSTGRLPRVVTANRMLKQMLFRCLVTGRPPRLTATHVSLSLRPARRRHWSRSPRNDAQLGAGGLAMREERDHPNSSSKP